MTIESEWIRALPEGLARQRNAILWLAEWSRDTPAVTSFSVGCSIGRGAADALSDVDAAIGVAASVGSSGLPTIEQVEASLVSALPAAGTLVDVLRGGSATTDFAIRTIFAQFADGLQLDLAIVAEPDIRRGSAAPDFVGVYRSEAARDLTTDRHPPAAAVPSGQAAEWYFLGWRALLDADKYVQRGSMWEAHNRIHEARHHIWQLWALTHGIAYPRHGLSQVIDERPDDLPPNIDATVATLDPHGLRAAIEAAADLLDTCAATCEFLQPAPPPIGSYARNALGLG